MQFYMVSQTSLAKSGSSVVEEYIPLWMADGTATGTAVTGQYMLVADGTNSFYNLSSFSSSSKLFTLNGNWNPTQKYALEVTVYTGTSANSASVALYDLVGTSTATKVSGSVISTTSTTATVLRSGTFTLTPGHTYGVAIYNPTSAYTYLIDASLIVFGQ